MSRDERWRELERAWESSPGDQALLAELIQARRRAGLGIPTRLAEAQEHPAHTIARFPPGCGVGYWELDGSGGWISPSRARRQVVIPRHTRWRVDLRRPEPEAWPALLEDLIALDPPGLHLDAWTLPRQVTELSRLSGLRELSLELPSSDWLEYDSPAARRGRGRASLEFLRPLATLERLALARVDLSWLSGPIPSVGIVSQEPAQLGELWPELRSLRICRDEFGASYTSRTNIGAPCLWSLATLPALEELRLEGWLISDWRQARFAEACPGVRLEVA